MKKFILISLGMICNISFGLTQLQLSFTLYVQDSQGRIDSITIAQHDNATVGVDSNLGEVDIYGTPLDSLDMRIIQRDSLHYECASVDHSAFPRTPIYFAQNIDLKKDFRPMDWSNYWHNETNIYEVRFHAQDYPIIIRPSPYNFVSWGYLDIYLVDTNCMTVDYEFYQEGSIFNADTLFTVLDSSIHTIALNFNIIVPTTKIENQKTSWRIISNPVETNLALVSEKTFDGVVSIFSALGTEIYSEKVQGKTEVDIDISELSKGVYFVRFYDGNTVNSKSFIKN